MSHTYDVIKRPLVTEKSFAAQQLNNVYAFEVDRRADKTAIKKAVEELFNVNVAEVRTAVVRGKVKRFGRGLGQRSSWKKAYVQLREGQSIALFEGA